MTKGLLPFLIILVLQSLTACNKSDGGSETYRLPMKIGSAWTYLLRTSTGGDAGVSSSVDTVRWEVKDSVTVFGFRCLELYITTSKDNWKSTVMAAYRQVPGDGLYLVAVDSSFSGEPLMKVTATPFASANEKVISERVTDDTVWNASDYGGGRIVKRLAKAKTPQNGYEITTWDDGVVTTRELFNDTGMIARYHAIVNVSDSVSGAKYSFADTLLLINATLGN